jgi:hypothetical protein
MRCKLSVVFFAVLVVVVLLPNGARAQSCPLNVPHVNGTWTILPYQMPINPISATLLPNGKVMIVAGSENDASNNSTGSESYRAAVWDPTGTTETSISVQELSYDVFCSGTAALPDGRSLIVGGTSSYAFTGENRASIFNPATGQYVHSQSMHAGRWYGTATALGDGRIMAMSGLNRSGGTSQTIEIYDLRNAGAGWGAPTSVPFGPPLFPRVVLLPNGKVFYTGQGSGAGTANGWMLDPATGSWTLSVATTMNRTYGSSVLLPLLPPSYIPRVMNFGGGSPATASTEIIDLSVASPSWTPGPSMSTGRIQMNAILLPNGKVLAEGGSVNLESPDRPGKTADLYDPVSNSMSSAGTAAFSRLYHSTALLLPDATVVSMGSNPGARGSYEPAIEVYTPPYLYDSSDHLITAKRPKITSQPFTTALAYNAPFQVSYASSAPIASAVLVRLGSVTHAFNMEQRVIGLCGSTSPCSALSNTLNLTTPPNGNIAPPGYYMLFLIDSAGVPSVATFLQLTPYATTPPQGAITTPTGNVTINAGQAVNFSTTSSAAAYSWVFPGGTPATLVLRSQSVTFATPGTYAVSLTVIDASGNSDPNPPTRKVTVLPASADFTISIAQAAQEVVPGGVATYTVSVTGISGFDGPVTLSVGSESGFQTGITSGGFNPATISGTGTSALTMNTTTSTVPWALSLTITGTSGTLSHTASSTLLVNLAPPSSLVAIAGDKQVSLSWGATVEASKYYVKRATVAGVPYETVACLASTATNFTDTGLVDGTAYHYVVSAAYAGNPNSGGESSNSGEAIATPHGSQSPPAAPSALTAKATKPKAIDLQWVQSVTPGISNNKIYRRLMNGGAYPTSPTATIGPNIFYRDSNLVSHTGYCYVVTASNTSGESARSNEACASAK